MNKTFIDLYRGSNNRYSLDNMPSVSKEMLEKEKELEKIINSNTSNGSKKERLQLILIEYIKSANLFKSALLRDDIDDVNQNTKMLEALDVVAGIKDRLKELD